MDAHGKPFGVFFNSSFGASEYASKDFFLLLGGFSATTTYSSSNIWEESNKEEKLDNLTLGFNSIEAAELILIWGFIFILWWLHNVEKYYYILGFKVKFNSY